MFLIGEGNGTPLQYSRLENPVDGGAWWAAADGVAKNWTRLSDFTFIFHFHALERKWQTHSSVLAWRLPGTGEPGGPPSVGSHGVRHDWSDLAAAAGFLVGLRVASPTLLCTEDQVLSFSHLFLHSEIFVFSCLLLSSFFESPPLGFNPDW